MKLRMVFLAAVGCLPIVSCNKSFLEVQPQGSALTQDKFANKAGVQQILIGAYQSLTGMNSKSTWWSTAATNWIWSDMAAGDCYVGGAPGSDLPHGVPDALNIQNFQVQSTTGFVDDKWVADYDGVARANLLITTANQANDMSVAEKNDAIAQARFLRGHFHFDAKRMWNNVPYVDENTANLNSLPNKADIWPNIEADFQYAYDNLPETQTYVGQVNKWAAASYLAKCYMYEKKYTQALTLLNTIIQNGKTSKGVKYALASCFHDNFDVTTENNAESVFQVQFSVDNGSLPNNANVGETAVGPQFGWGVANDFGYGYYKQPTFNLANAYKTDVNGLPMLDTFNVTNMKNDMGVASSNAFVPYQGTIDPRLDWSIGRRAVPYLDWGVNPGQSWVRNQSFGGPYVNMKNMFTQVSQNVGWNSILAWYYEGNSAVNYNIIRYADVLLWAAECEVEVGSMENARALVNQVRSRAKTGCSVAVDNGSGAPSAHYYVDTYNTPWSDQNTARKAVRFERRIELSLEGHRFFDLVRWGNASDEINAYLSKEQTRGVSSVISGSNFQSGKNEYYPIPQKEITLDPALIQNPGY